jgi:hypothetical protein
MLSATAGFPAGRWLVQWWWCLRHATVEKGPGCPNKERLGPYATEQQAATVLERTTQRTAEEDARDAAEDDWDDERD